MSKFYKIYFTVIGVFLALLILGAVFFNIVLADYEKSNAGSTAENFFKDKISAFNIGNEYDNGFENAQTVDSIFSEKYQGKEFNMHAGKSGTDGSQIYVVKQGDDKVLSFKVSPTDETTTFGFTKYKIEDLVLEFSKEFVIKAPENCEVLVNGKTLGSEYLTGNTEILPIKLPDGLTPQKYVFYKVSGLTSIPEITAKNEDGNPLDVTKIDSENKCTVGFSSDKSLETEHKEYVLEVMKGYAAYIQNDATFANINKYFEKGTETYNFIKSQEPLFVWAHDGFGFENEWAGEFTKYSDTVFTCRVRATQVLYKTGVEPYKDYIDLTFVMHKVGGKFMVYNLKSNT